LTASRAPAIHKEAVRSIGNYCEFSLGVEGVGRSCMRETDARDIAGSLGIPFVGLSDREKGPPPRITGWVEEGGVGRRGEGEDEAVVSVSDEALPRRRDDWRRARAATPGWRAGVQLGAPRRRDTKMWYVQFFYQ